MSGNAELILAVNTTGLPLYQARSSDPAQPRIVEIAAILADVSSGDTYEVLHLYVRPQEDWPPLDPEAHRLHNLSYGQLASMPGAVSESEMLERFLRLYAECVLTVAHDHAFVDRMLRIALIRVYGEEVADKFKTAAPSSCIASFGRELLKLPSPKGHGFRKPTLTECLSGVAKMEMPHLLEQVNADRIRNGLPVVHEHSALCKAFAVFAVRAWAVAALEGRVKTDG